MKLFKYDALVAQHVAEGQRVILRDNLVYPLPLDYKHDGDGCDLIAGQELHPCDKVFWSTTGAQLQAYLLKHESQKRSDQVLGIMLSASLGYVAIIKKNRAENTA